MVIRRDERITRLALGSANRAGRLKSGDDAPQLVEILALHLIDPDPNQPRRSFDDGELRELADSLATIGQLQPIIVVRVGERYRLEVGERRWRAAQLAGQASIRALVRGSPRDAHVTLIAQIAENEQRAPLSTSELVDAVRQLHAAGMKGVEIAAALGKPKSRISELGALAAAPEPIAALFDLIGPGLSYQLLQQWRADAKATLDFVHAMPFEHISRITIAALGDVDKTIIPPQPQQALAAIIAPIGGEGEGASPRSRTAPAAPCLPDGLPDAAQDGDAITIGMLVVAHDEHGEGQVIFGADIAADHLAVRFEGGGTHVLHKRDVRLLRTLTAAPTP